MADTDELDISERLILSDKNNYTPQRYALNLKDSINLGDLASSGGAEFEIDRDNQPPRDSDDEDAGKNYFDEEDLFQQLNHEALGIDDEEDPDSTDGPFEYLEKDMEALTEDKGVLKKVIRPGVGPVAPKTASLRFHYNAYREYGDEPYDSSRFRGKPETMRIGAGAFPGVDVALATMRKGELSKFLFKKEYVFNDLGCEPRVPGATVLWEIELISFVDHGITEDINQMPLGDKRKASFKHLLSIANSHKEYGNDHYKRKQTSSAISKYMKAIKLLEECSLQNEKEEKEMNEVLLKLYSNMSQCALEQGQSGRAIKYARKVLYVDPKNIKALFRLGKAYMKEGEFDRARDNYKKALRREPNNRDVKNGLIELDKNVAAFKKMEKEKYQMMMSKYLNKPVGATGKEERSVVEKVSEDIKEITAQFGKFIENKEMFEMVLPATLTDSEIEFVRRSALNMGLTTVTKELGPNKKQLLIRKLT